MSQSLLSFALFSSCPMISIKQWADFSLSFSPYVYHHLHLIKKYSSTAFKVGIDRIQAELFVLERQWSLFEDIYIYRSISLSFVLTFHPLLFFLVSFIILRVKWVGVVIRLSFFAHSSTSIECNLNICAYTWCNSSLRYTDAILFTNVLREYHTSRLYIEDRMTSERQIEEQ